MLRTLLTGALGFTLFCFSGCGDNDLPTTVSVGGTVTVNGQVCPAAGSIRFLKLPQVCRAAPGVPSSIRRADSTSPFRDGDGLVPGTYQVQIECWKIPPANGAPGESFLPADFAPTDFLVDAEQGRVTADYDVPAANAVR